MDVVLYTPLFCYVHHPKYMKMFCYLQRKRCFCMKVETESRHIIPSSQFFFYFIIYLYFISQRKYNSFIYFVFHLHKADFCSSFHLFYSYYVCTGKSKRRDSNHHSYFLVLRPTTETLIHTHVQKEVLSLQKVDKYLSVMLQNRVQ